MNGDIMILVISSFKMQLLSDDYTNPVDLETQHT